MAEAEQPRAVIKSCAEDFFVDELLDMPFSGEGEHAYFRIEKNGWNSRDVAKAIADAYNVPEVAVGYAGLKDKHAVTRQWFSVATPEDSWLPQLSHVSCLTSARHVRKLRRGQHQGNRFRVVLRKADGCSVDMLLQLQAGFANAFGPQRLSTDNVEQAQRWILQRRRRRIPKHRSAWHLSVLRSYLFNTILAARCAAGNYNSLLDGDVSVDGIPTAPLWGRGRSATTGTALLIEQEALSAHAQLCDALEYSGVDQGRRKLAERPQDLQVQAMSDNEFVLEFVLPPGVYATTMLAACVRLEDA